MDRKKLLQKFKLEEINPGAFSDRWLSSGARKTFDSISPIDGAKIASTQVATEQDYESVVASSYECFQEWRDVPAPKRGEIVRQIGNALRDSKRELGQLVTIEMGKILAEGEGEVQEAIDIADFAVGLSRQLYGLTMHSERSKHRMYEQWHPLGPIGVITAFNFPVAVWAWNAMIAAVCGDTVIWKPSEQVPLTAIATHNICAAVAKEHGFPGLFSLLIDNGPELGKKLAADRRIPLVSATGSCRMGRSVGQVVGARLGKCILELGGNNAIIVCDDADLDLVVPAVCFGAVGTAGQRCTSTRRILIEKNIEKEFLARLTHAYQQVKIGDPLKKETLMGPLINNQAVEQYQNTISLIAEQGGKVLAGGKLVEGLGSDLFVEPTIVKADKNMPLLHEEVFAPILYVVSVDSLDEAILIQNEVPQGLSSAIFTQNLKNAERFLSHSGSDCGIANVNIGTSGAEIGGAFGGEKDTGGGRESGSDSWKQYMRRQTCTINYSNDLPLAQGISFDIS